jgi:hypothetical protein
MAKLAVLVLVVMAIGTVANGDLLSQYEFEGTWNTNIPGSWNATPIGDAALGVDVVKGNAVDINSPTSWLYVGNDPVYATFTTQITMAAWIRCTDQGYTSLQRIVGKGYGWYLNIIAAGTVQLIVRDSANPAATIVTDGTVNIRNDGLWHHVAATWDTATGETDIYVDGVLDVTATHVATFIAPSSDTYLFGMGARATSSTVGANIFRGWMDDVRVYNNALTAAEVETLAYLASLVKTHHPSPSSGATNVFPDVNLGWGTGVGAVSHDVYLGTSFNDVNTAGRLLADLNGDGIVGWSDLALLSEYWLADPTGSQPCVNLNDDDIENFFDYALLAQDWGNAASSVFKGNQTATSYNPPGDLAISTAYYWRIDEVNGCDTVGGDVWSLTTQSGKAFNPSPANGASASINPTLTWSAGYGATSHDVYFGTTAPLASQGNQPGTSYTPAGPLAMDANYYWRIDEINPSGTLTGDEWSFKTAGIIMQKEPYLIYPNNNAQMSVLWQVNVTVSCSIDWGTDTSYSLGSVNTTESDPNHQHKYTITDLTPGTKYYYRVTAGSSTVRTGSFNAAPAADATSVKFMVYGDTRNHPETQSVVNGRMIAEYTVDPAYQSITLFTGDWCDMGRTETSWTADWFNTGQANMMTFRANVPISGSKGNHEIQVGATDDGDLYGKYFPFTVVSPYYWSFDYGPAHILVIDQYAGGLSGSISAAQLAWIESDLAATDKEWKFLVFHAPGWTGSTRTVSQVRTAIQPLCVTYGVDIVFASHEHFYTRCGVNGVKHITTGGGGASLDVPSMDYPYVEAIAGVNHYCAIDIAGSTLYFKAVGSDGTVLDTFTIVHDPG